MRGGEALDMLRAELDREIVSASAPSDRRMFVELSSGSAVTPCVKLLRERAGARLMTITCVDEPAFRELLYHYSLGGDVLTLRARLWKPDVTVPSIAPSDPAAELIEHEITELFGVTFEGNPRTKNMILPDGWTDVQNPLARQQGSIEVRIDRNLANIVASGATTSPSKRVAKVRTGLGLDENPPLCGTACPGSCATQDISDSSGASSRHPGLVKKREVPK
jgi:NADH:ubiquinone oxidoreductase subunit C